MWAWVLPLPQGLQMVVVVLMVQQLARVLPTGLLLLLLRNAWMCPRAHCCPGLQTGHQKRQCRHLLQVTWENEGQGGAAQGVINGPT